jgi:hypothetical protein
MVCGSHLPYRQLGFASVNDLLKSIPDVVSCHNVNGGVLVKAVLKNESAHINKLVQGQKGTKKRPRMLQASSVQRGPGSLLRNPINANNRPAAPWNFPKYYTPPAMRSVVLVPPSSSIRQPMLPRTTQQQLPQQAVQPPVHQQVYQVPHFKQATQLMQPKPSQNPPVAAPKLPQVNQRPLPPTNLQLPGAQAIPPTGRPAKPAVPTLPVVRYAALLLLLLFCNTIFVITFRLQAQQFPSRKATAIRPSPSARRDNLRGCKNEKRKVRRNGSHRQKKVKLLSRRIHYKRGCLRKSG